MLNPEASRAAAEYLTALATEMAPDVVEEFRDQVIALDRDREDRSAEALALIENHDVANDPRTMESYLLLLGGREPEPVPEGFEEGPDGALRAIGAEGPKP